MKTNWRVKLDGKGSNIIWDRPINRFDLYAELLKYWKNVEVIE